MNGQPPRGRRDLARDISARMAAATFPPVLPMAAMPRFDACSRRSFVFGASALVAAGTGFAQTGTWPDRPITYVVPFPAGGISDVYARLTAKSISEVLGVPVVIDNRPGATGIVGTEFVARGAPDGNLLVSAGTGTLGIAPHLIKMRFDPATALQPLAMMVLIPSAVVVSTQSPYRTLAELVAAARARPGQLTYGSGGYGTLIHISAELFASKSGIQFNHVPYKGEGPAMQDLLGGQIDMVFSPLASTLPQIAAGKLRALAVTSRQRSKALPQVPTMIEAGVPDYDASQWLGVLAPTGLPPNVADKLSAALVRSVSQPEIQAYIDKTGSIAMPMGAAEAAAFLHKEYEYWGSIVRALNIRSE